MITTNTEKKLRPYQTEGVSEIRRAFLDGHRKVCYVLPTGGGKTELGSEMIRMAAARGNKVLVLAHRTELIKQWSARVEIPHGIIKAGMDCNRDALVQIASVQSLARREVTDSDFIFADECHHAPAGEWERILAKNPNAWLLGLTATPVRLDNKGLKPSFTHMVIGPQKQWLIDNGYLVPSLVVNPGRPDMRGVRSVAGEFKPRDTQRVMDTPTIYGDAIREWRKWADGKLTAAFCTTVEHAENTARAFNSAGIPAVSMDGKMSAGERADLIHRWEQGEFLVVCSCNLFSEGFDLPAIECVLGLRPTKSLTLWLQQCGRASRLADGKNRAIILDHAGNIWTHGHPDWDREWELTSDKRKDKPPALASCPECYAVFYPQPECPVCGGNVRGFASENARKGPELSPDTELVLFSGEGWTAGDIRKVPFKELIRKARTQADLHAIAHARGYKPGWVRQQIKLRPRFQHE